MHLRNPIIITININVCHVHVYANILNWLKHLIRLNAILRRDKEAYMAN